MHPTQSRTLFPDWWWRFDKYKIVDGYIRPNAQRLNRFEPWAEYKVPHGKQSISQPYHSLLQLAGRIERGDLEKARQNAEIERWCGEHGLLGVLLHRSEAVVLPKAGKQDFFIRYTRATGGWLRTRDWDARLEAGALMRDLGEFWATLRPVEEWMRFFPSLNDPARIPPPFSEPFWNQYAEPLSDFLAAAQLLHRTVNDMRRLLLSKMSVQDKRREFFEEAAEPIHALTATIRPLFELETGRRYGTSWAGGSLLTNFAMMAALDLSRRLLICANSNCGAFFVTNSAEAKYCSARCRGTVQMRSIEAESPNDQKEEEN